MLIRLHVPISIFISLPPLCLFFCILLSCLPIVVASDDLNSGFDHRTHAVPGGPYRQSDNTGAGSALVRLNGGLSHSHFFNPKTGATGRIVKYTWQKQKGNKVICKRVVCDVRFSHGVTVIRLTVVDSTGDEASATTRVIVFSGARGGLRLLFYPNNGQVRTPLAATKAKLSRTRPRFDMYGTRAYPPGVLDDELSVRVLGDISIVASGFYRFRLVCEGGACLLRIGNVLRLKGSFGYTQSRGFFKKGSYRLHSLLRRKFNNAPGPVFVLLWQPPKAKRLTLVPKYVLSHHPSLYPPVIHSVTPKSASVGSIIRITGSSFVNVRAVRIGGVLCAGPVARSEFLLTCVVPGGSGTRKLTVQTSAGLSNFVTLEIKSLNSDLEQPGGRRSGLGRDDNGNEGAFSSPGTGPLGYYQPIRFSKTFLKRGSSVWKMPQLTSIALGPDGKYYIGSLDGYVHVIETDLGTQIKAYCRSRNVGPNRSVLGVAFNPAQTNMLRLYATTSVLYWNSKNLLPFRKGWSNGQIIAMQRTKSFCLERVAVVISGLPVSNYDHSVNSLAFDQYGRMLVTVGCTSNAGVSQPDDPLGGIPDSPLSGSIVIANVLKKGFNGRIRYNQYQNPGTASKISGDVDVYAAGIRNSFGIVVHSNGHVYATDNGANPEFGDMSLSCHSKGPAKHERDTLKRIRRGGFYGHANRNRGQWDKRQCKHRIPGTKGKDFDAAMATLEPSTNGLIEYTANTFGGQLRGDLMATKFAIWGTGTTFRVRLNDDGDEKSLFPMVGFSGLSVAMSPMGGLVMPRVYQGKVAVLTPIEKNPRHLVVTSVNPFRGPMRGGNIITVTGWNLNPPLTVTVGDRPCTGVGKFYKGRRFSCRVPSGSGKAAVVVKRFGKVSRSYGFEYVYLNM